MPMVSLYLSPSHTLPTSLPPFATRASSQPITNKPRNKLSFLLLSPRRASSVLASSTGVDGNGASLAVEEKKAEGTEGETPAAAELKVGKEKKKSGSASNGAALVIEGVPKFSDNRWVNGTWDLQQFKKGSSTDWDAVIEAEARRRKWLQDNPEASSNGDPVLFDTSIVPWWAWIKKYHLPEAELLNGRAAMIGFFMAYFVDSLTGVGLVGQMGNFFCKSLLFVAVSGVLLIRKNEDLDNLKKLIDETTFYDKQWQATWQDEAADDTRKE